MHIPETATMLLQLEESELDRLRARLQRAEEMTKDPHVLIIMQLDLAAQCGRVSYLKKFLDENLCYRKSCRAPDANWWNPSTRHYYCRACAQLLNEASPGLCHEVHSEGVTW